MLLFEPKEFNDISRAADQLIAGKIIVINLHKMPQSEKQRIVDFINGVVYSHQGRITKGGQDLILCSPGKNEMIGNSFVSDTQDNTVSNDQVIDE